jgi:hypothetical protein
MEHGTSRMGPSFGRGLSPPFLQKGGICSFHCRLTKSRQKLKSGLRQSPRDTCWCACRRYKSSTDVFPRLRGLLCHSPTRRFIARTTFTFLAPATQLQLKTLLHRRIECMLHRRRYSINFRGTLLCCSTHAQLLYVNFCYCNSSSELN